MYIYIYICICVYISASYTHVCIHIYPTYMYYTCKCVYIYIYIYRRVHFIHANVYIYICIYVYIYIYIYISIYIHIYTCARETSHINVIQRALCCSVFDCLIIPKIKKKIQKIKYKAIKDFFDYFGGGLRVTPSATGRTQSKSTYKSWQVTHANKSCYTVCKGHSLQKRGKMYKTGKSLSIFSLSYQMVYMNESYSTYECVMSHVRMSHSTHTKESCHTCEWVMSHIWMRHVTHTNESWHTYE